MERSNKLSKHLTYFRRRKSLDWFKWYRKQMSCWSYRKSLMLLVERQKIIQKKKKCLIVTFFKSLNFARRKICHKSLQIRSRMKTNYSIKSQLERWKRSFRLRRVSTNHSYYLRYAIFFRLLSSSKVNLRSSKDSSRGW